VADIADRIEGADQAELAIRKNATQTSKAGFLTTFGPV
jgi:hypothetical protein